MLAFSLKQHCVYVQPCRPVSITYKPPGAKIKTFLIAFFIIFFNEYEEFCMHVFIRCVYCADSDGRDGINTPLLTVSLLILILLLLKPVIPFKNSLYRYLVFLLNGESSRFNWFRSTHDY